MKKVLDIFEQLASSIKCPPEFYQLLLGFIPGEGAPVMLLATNWISPTEIADRLNMANELIENIISALYDDGLIDLQPEGNRVKAKSFYSIINTMLGEGRTEKVPEKYIESIREYYMTTRLEIYDGFLESAKIETSSEVLTTWEALSFHRHPHEGITTVVVQDEAKEILNHARTIALLPCSCRLTFQRCTKTVETCLNLDAAAEEALSRGVGRGISKSEAEEILAVANREGLVHLAIHAPGKPRYALCSCCPCCCHDLQALLRYGRTEWIRRANYVAITDQDQCISCGECANRCYFGVRTISQGKLVLDETKCYGCGLCITSCPIGAIQMTPIR